MFTGIVEDMAVVTSKIANGTNVTFELTAGIAPGFKVDQSVSHDGACLTVEAVHGNAYRVTAIAETLAKTNLSQWEPGYTVNLEQCLAFGGRLDGHLVQGHVDATGTCTARQDLEGSIEFEISFPPRFAHLLVEKGSICLNGISLTVFGVTGNSFRVAIVPYTASHTNIGALVPGRLVNLEFDIVGKYITRSLSLRHAEA